MGGGHHEEFRFPTIPDWRSYKVDENTPELLKLQKALAAKGLKDPWIRNEVWRYDVRIFGSKWTRSKNFFFRGFKYGLVAAIITTAIEKTFFNQHHDDDHH